MLAIQNRSAVLKQELAAFWVEKERFETYFNESNEEIVPYRSLYRPNAATIMALWLDYQRMAEKDNQVTLKYKLKNLLRYGIISFSFYKNSNEQVIDLLQKLYYERKIEELNDQIQTLTKRLENFHFDRAMQEYSDNPMQLFKAELAERFTYSKQRTIFTKDALWKDFAAYDYAENSMLSSITKLFANVPRTLLQEHYRCHPKIIGFCNQKFYNNELIVLTEENHRDKPLVVYKTAKGKHARGNYNQRQIDMIVEEVLPEQGVDATKHSIGIISFYRMQRDKLIEAIGNPNIEVDTVHKYQGREKDVVILATVVNDVNEFVDNPNLINVAVSRAVDKLIVVVADNVDSKNANVGDLLV